MKLSWFLWAAFSCVLFASSAFSQELGTRWEVLHGLSASQCDVVEDTTLWCVDKKQKVYKQDIGDPNSVEIGGRLTYISAGPAGVWGTNKKNKVFYRTETYGNASAIGEGWKKIRRASLKNIAVGDDIVAGTDNKGKVYVRVGISNKRPQGKKWRSLKGQKCEQVDIYGTNDLWCITKKGKVYKYEWTVNNWINIRGRLQHISTGPAGVWAINSKENIYHRDGTYGDSEAQGDSWTRVSGQMVSISVGRNIVVGTSKKNRIWFKKGVSLENPIGVGEWRSMSRIPQRKCSTTGADETLWCVDKKDYVYNFDIETRSWTLVKGRMNHISAGSSGVWAVNSKNKVYHRVGTYGQSDDPGTTWQKQTGSLKNVAVGSNVVVGTDNNDTIFIRDGITAQNPSGITWRKISGKAKQCGIFGAENTIWCVNADDDISKYLPDTDDWELVTGKLEYISAGYAGVWGVNSEEGILHRIDTYNATDTTGSSWEQVTGKLRNLSVGKTMVVGTNLDDDVYLRLGIAHVDREAVIQYVGLDWKSV